jgi:hypothetical protein
MKLIRQSMLLPTPFTGACLALSFIPTRLDRDTLALHLGFHLPE